MSVSNTLSKSATLANASTVGTAETVTSGSNPFVSEVIPPSSTNLPVACAFVNAKLKSFVAHADADMTVYTNEASSGTPQEKIVLKAGRAYIWSLTESWLGEVGDSAASPFDGDVTGLFVTSVAGGTLTISPIVDPT